MGSPKLRKGTARQKNRTRRRSKTLPEERQFKAKSGNPTVKVSNDMAVDMIARIGIMMDCLSEIEQSEQISNPLVQRCKQAIEVGFGLAVDLTALLGIHLHGGSLPDERFIDIITIMRQKSCIATQACDKLMGNGLESNKVYGNFKQWCKSHKYSLKDASHMQKALKELYKIYPNHRPAYTANNQK